MVTMDQTDMREFGRLEARVEAQGREIGELKASSREMNRKMDELLALANKGRGGFWAGMTFVSLLSSAAGWFSHYVLGR